MTILAFGVGLPLSMMRNLHSLASFSALSLLFYTGFVVQVGPADVVSFKHIHLSMNLCNIVA